MEQNGPAAEQVAAQVYEGQVEGLETYAAHHHKEALELNGRLIALAGLTGCAGLSSAPSGNQPAGVRTQIRAGNNVPAGYVVDFQMPLSSVTLVSDQGQNVSLLPGTTTVEQAPWLASRTC
jgi:hypothetical protein